MEKKKDKKRSSSGIERLILSGPTWAEEQYKEWIKDSKSLHKWTIR